MIHYRHLGYPKSGTNWLWSQFMEHPEVDGKLSTHYKEFDGTSLEHYQNTYNKFKVSVNLHTHIFNGDYVEGHYATPKEIHHHATHLGLSFRNPYEVLNSLYNMEKNRNPNFKDTPDQYTKLVANTKIYMYTDTKKIFNYWEDCKLPINYTFYDDLCADPKQYMHNLCDYIGIGKFYNGNMNRKFQTTMNDPLVFDDASAIQFINEGISIIEDHTKRDLSSWKRAT